MVGAFEPEPEPGLVHGHHFSKLKLNLLVVQQLLCQTFLSKVSIAKINKGQRIAAGSWFRKKKFGEKIVWQKYNLAKIYFGKNILWQKYTLSKTNLAKSKVGENIVCQKYSLSKIQFGETIV